MLHAQMHTTTLGESHIPFIGQIIITRFGAALLVLVAMAEEQCSYRVIPRRDLQLGAEIGAGTEKRVLVGTFDGRQVAVMHIHGHSKQRDFELQEPTVTLTLALALTPVLILTRQEKIATHPVLGSHPGHSTTVFRVC